MWPGIKVLVIAVPGNVDFSICKYECFLKEVLQKFESWIVFFFLRI